MRWRASGGLPAVVLAGVALSAGSVSGEESPVYLPLDEVMTGATGLSTIAGAYLFVARPDGGYVCAINLNDRFFPSVREGSAENAFANRPGALCVSARMFEDLSVAGQEKL